MPLSDIVRTFLYAIALSKIGDQNLHGWIGQEPTVLDDQGEFSTFTDENSNRKKPYNSHSDLGTLLCASVATGGKPKSDPTNDELFELLTEFAGGPSTGFKKTRAGEASAESTPNI